MENGTTAYLVFAAVVFDDDDENIAGHQPPVFKLCIRDFKKGRGVAFAIPIATNAGVHSIGWVRSAGGVGTWRTLSSPMRMNGGQSHAWTQIMMSIVNDSVNPGPSAAPTSSPAAEWRSLRRRLSFRIGAKSWFLAPLVCLFGMWWRPAADEPRIELIEPFSTNLVLIHFNTEPNRAYTVQYFDPSPIEPEAHLLPGGSSKTNLWRTWAVFPAIPFPNHYIMVDTRTNMSRWYRLLVEP